MTDMQIEVYCIDKFDKEDYYTVSHEYYIEYSPEMETKLVLLGFRKWNLHSPNDPNWEYRNSTVSYATILEEDQLILLLDDEL